MTTGTNPNTITSGPGTALNVANTTIGASGLTFQSISSNGGTNGIVLNTTGTLGGLDGHRRRRRCQEWLGRDHPEHHGRRHQPHEHAEHVAHATQLLSGTGDHGINISSVTNFTYQDATLIGVAADRDNDEHGINILNLFGTTSDRGRHHG